MFWFTLMLSPTNSPFFFSQIRTRSFPINWPSLISTSRSPVIFWRDSDLINLRTNTIQISICPNKAFAICDHKSDQTRSATHVNKTCLVWLMFRVQSNQHYQQRANQKLRSRANAVFQNRGVCGQAFPSLPSPSPVIPFFCSRPNVLDELARKRLLRRLVSTILL